MSKKILSIACLTSALAFAGPALAEEPNFDELDQNKDGMLTVTEASKSNVNFAKADANSDGRLDRKEYEEAMS